MEQDGGDEELLDDVAVELEGADADDPAKALSRHKRGERTIWQRRFWEHVIRDDADLRHHVEYIHFNPVKHGYVTRASDWPYSTFRQFVRNGIYPADWASAAEDASSNFGE